MSSYRTVFAVCITLSLAVPAAPGDYGNEHLQGSFGFQVMNNTVIPTIGVFEFDGSGAVTGRRVVIGHGMQRVIQNFEGTYQVNGDGTGTMQITLDQETPIYMPGSYRMDRIEKAEFVMVKGGRELLLTHILRVCSPDECYDHHTWESFAKSQLLDPCAQTFHPVGPERPDEGLSTP